VPVVFRSRVLRCDPPCAYQREQPLARLYGPDRQGVQVPQLLPLGRGHPRYTPGVVRIRVLTACLPARGLPGPQLQSSMLAAALNKRNYLSDSYRDPLPCLDYSEPHNVPHQQVTLLRQGHQVSPVIETNLITLNKNKSAYNVHLLKSADS
jgi:hypothetical protein